MTRSVHTSLGFILLSVLLFGLFGCGDDSPSPPDTTLTISMGTTEGHPGEIVPFTCTTALTAPAEFRLRFGEGMTPVLGGENEGTYEAMIPVVPAGTVSVYLENAGTGAASNSVSFNVLSLPETGLPPGAVADEVLTTQEESFEILRTVVVPRYAIASGLSTGNTQALQAEMTRASTILEQTQAMIATLPEEERRVFDQLLCSGGILDLVNSSSTGLARAAREMDVNSVYSGHYACAAMDGFSSVLTAARRVWAVAGLVASVGSGGSLAVVFAAGAVAMAIVDEGIDAYLPTDLNGLRVESEGQLVVPLGGDRDVRVVGKFTTQSNPVHGTIRMFVSALCALVGTAPGLELETFIIDTFATMGINVSDELSSLSGNWQTVDYVEHVVDPVFYEAGLLGFLNVLASQVGLSISDATGQGFLNAIGGFDYQAENASIATFDEDSSTLHGLQAGSSQLLYNGYRFKPLSGWAGLIGSILGIEWPTRLSTNQIASAPFTVQEMTGNTVHVRSAPAGASVYLDGTNMNRVTPTTLESVAAGHHHVRIFLQGYNEHNETFDLVGGGVYMIDADLGPPLPPIPVFTITAPLDGQHFSSNVITVSGTIRLQDAAGNTSAFTGDRAILTLNGVDKELNVSAGSFGEPATIGAGANTLRFRANSPSGDTGTSDEITVHGDFATADIEIVLTWNTPTSDLDLHVWNPAGEHSYYRNKVISDGALDIDVTEGFGPETFTAPNALSGTYVVKINCWSLDHDTYADASVVIRIRGQEYGTYGPHHFTVADANGWYGFDPLAWWEVASFSVVGGTAEPVDGALPLWLAERIERDMRSLPAK